MALKNCRVCSKEFIASKFGQKHFCSKECARSVKKTYWRRYYHGTTEKPCGICKTIFKPSRKRKIYCSDHCQKEAEKINHEKYLAQPGVKERIAKRMQSPRVVAQRAAYRARPEYNYYIKLWKAGLSVKDIKRVEKMPKVSD